MVEKSVTSPVRSEEEQRLATLSDGGLQYLACIGISHNLTVPEDRRKMFGDLAIHVFEIMPKEEKEQLVGYIAWKSEIVYAARRKSSIANRIGK